MVGEQDGLLAIAPVAVNGLIEAESFPTATG
jgi:hypothetical protein